MFVTLLKTINGNKLFVSECGTGFFGHDCVLTCSNCMNGGKCNNNGDGCVCAPGYHGLLCNSTCPTVSCLSVQHLWACMTITINLFLLLDWLVLGGYLVVSSLTKLQYLFSYIQWYTYNCCNDVSQNYWWKWSFRFRIQSQFSQC